MRIGSPTFRQYLINEMEGFLDPEYQKELKIKDESMTAGYRSMELSSSLSFILNDMWILDTDVIEEDVLVDRYFYNKEEFQKVYDWLKFIEDNMEYRQRDLYYLNHPLWGEVVRMAKEAYDLLMANNEKYNFAKNLEEFENMTLEERMKYLGHED